MKHSLVFGLIAVLAAAAANASPDWPSFRGPASRGVEDGFHLPDTWDGERKEGIAWSTPIPGLGHSSPIVWGNRVFVTTAISGKDNPELKVGLYGNIDSVIDDTKHDFKVYCLDRKTGKILWEKTAISTVPKVKRHTKATHANPTSATDGKHLVAFFGSEGLYCYDFNGKLLWKKDLGVLDSGYYVVPTAQWGVATSPIIYRDKVLLQCDNQKGSYLGAFNVTDGKEVWKTPREEVPTWSSPNVYRSGDKDVVVVNGWKHIGGYDLATGKEIWHMKGGGDIPVPTPIIGDGLVYITNAHGRMAPIYAVKTTATGDISLPDGVLTNDGVAWSYAREGGYMQTPVLYKGHLYVCRDNGVLSCYNAATGERVYNQRLGTGRTGFTASGVAGDNKLFFTSEEGDTYVIQAGAEFKILKQNALGEICMATPALNKGSLIFRTRGHVVCIGK